MERESICFDRIVLKLMLHFANVTWWDNESIAIVTCINKLDIEKRKRKDG